MHSKVVETLIGAIVLAVAGGFLIFAYKGSQVAVEEGYTIDARFENVAGINTGSDVRIGGIKIGTVLSMVLDKETYDAIVSLNIKTDTYIPTDSTAAIVSSGLLGDKYIAITPGADDEMLKTGDVLDYTQSSVSLEELIGRFVFSGGGVDSEK